jgi:hypothetical protein
LYAPTGEPLPFPSLLFRDVADLNDGPDGSVAIQEGAGREGYRIEVPVLVNERLLPLLAHVLRVGLVDRTLLERIGGSVGVHVVNHVVEGATLLLQREAGETLGRRVHIRAVLALVHDEQRECRVVRYRFELAAVVIGPERMAHRPSRFLDGPGCGIAHTTLQIRPTGSPLNEDGVR